MQATIYRRFSAQVHDAGCRNGRLNACQFELTFRCGLRCAYCYSLCYNDARHARREMDTRAVMRVLDELRRSGVVWLGLTGGDPLCRRDFPAIYRYARRKGFIVTVFTNGFSMTEPLARLFKAMPPLAIEMTLNAFDPAVHDRLTGVPGSHARVMQGIALMRAYGLPLKIKNQMVRQNAGEFGPLRAWARRQGIRIEPNFKIHARLDGDTAPCRMRVPVRQAAALERSMMPQASGCDAVIPAGRRAGGTLFRCAVGGDGVYIDPYGYAILCTCLRTPRVNLARYSLRQAREMLTRWVGRQGSASGTPCATCAAQGVCFSCPAKALQETGSMAKPVPYLCALAKTLHRAPTGKAKR